MLYASKMTNFKQFQQWMIYHVAQHTIWLPNQLLVQKRNPLFVYKNRLYEGLTIKFLIQVITPANIIKIILLVITLNTC